MSEKRRTRREIAASGQVFHYADGSRGIRWSDGLFRIYTQDELAAMFLDAVEKGKTNPLLDKLLLAHEKREMYRALEVLSEDMASLVTELEKVVA